MYDLIGDIEDMISGVSISMIETNLATLPVAQYAERKNIFPDPKIIWYMLS